jgi:hypothetical protein
VVVGDQGPLDRGIDHPVVLGADVERQGRCMPETTGGGTDPAEMASATRSSNNQHYTRFAGPAGKRGWRELPARPPLGNLMTGLAAEGVQRDLPY